MDGASRSGPPLPPYAIGQAVRRTAESILADARTHHLSSARLPDRDAITAMLHDLDAVLFPGFVGSREISRESINEHVRSVLESVVQTLWEQVSRSLRYAEHIDVRGPDTEDRCAACDAQAATVVTRFLEALPSLRRQLSLDVQAAYDGDPAAQHTDEIIFCYPGIRALSIHRVANLLYQYDVPLIPRIMAEYAHSMTGIDIHPGARIGASFFLDHGTGVVIGETTVIGDHCKIYQGVTLGAKSFQKDERGRLMRGVKRHPTLEDHVTVYAGATILGGDTTIGAGSVINGGVFLTNSVPPGHVVRAPRVELTLRNNPELPPGNYAI